MNIIGIVAGIILLLIICAVCFNVLQRVRTAWNIGEPWNTIIEIVLILAALAIFVAIVIAAFGMFGIHVVIPGLHA